MGFPPRQAYWSGLSFPSPGDPPHQDIKQNSPALADYHWATWDASQEALNELVWFQAQTSHPLLPSPHVRKSVLYVCFSIDAPCYIFLKAWYDLNDSIMCMCAWVCLYIDVSLLPCAWLLSWFNLLLWNQEGYQGLWSQAWLLPVFLGLCLSV